MLPHAQDNRRIACLFYSRHLSCPLKSITNRALVNILGLDKTANIETASSSTGLCCHLCSKPVSSQLASSNPICTYLYFLPPSCVYLCYQLQPLHVVANSTLHLLKRKGRSEDNKCGSVKYETKQVFILQLVETSSRLICVFTLCQIWPPMDPQQSRLHYRGHLS